MFQTPFQFEPFFHCQRIDSQRFLSSVVDRNRLCSDPDLGPGAYVHLDPDPTQDPNHENAFLILKYRTPLN
jgi:hypothetical protein